MTENRKLIQIKLDLRIFLYCDLSAREHVEKNEKANGFILGGELEDFRRKHSREATINIVAKDSDAGVVGRVVVLPTETETYSQRDGET